jgi:hypothetical protein
MASSVVAPDSSDFRRGIRHGLEDRDKSASGNAAARRHHGGSRIRDKIRGIVADLITGGAVLE